jgi:hypothetical protein
LRERVLAALHYLTVMQDLLHYLQFAVISSIELSVIDCRLLSKGLLGQTHSLNFDKICGSIHAFVVEVRSSQEKSELKIGMVRIS